MGVAPTFRRAAVVLLAFGLWVITAVPVAASIQEILRHFYPALTEPIAPERRRAIPLPKVWRKRSGQRGPASADGEPGASLTRARAGRRARLTPCGGPSPDR